MSSDIAHVNFEKTIEYGGHAWTFKGTVDTAAYFLTANLNVNFGIGLIVSPDVAGNLRGLGIGAYYKISDKTDGEAVYHIKDGALYADLKATTDGKRYEPLTIDLVNI